MVANFVEPPELFDRAGEKIVVFADPDGNWFSNHPDYPLALALHQQAEAAKVKAAQEAAQAEPEVEEDETVEEDNGDGVLQYGEMKSADLAAEARKRGLSVPSGTKRSQVIEMLEADDAAKAAS